MLRPEFQAELDRTLATMALLKAAVVQHFGAPAQIIHIARDVTHLPIWKNGHRPDWWGDEKLRKFLTTSHRQMTITQCCAEVERRFNRPFSRSSLQRYWALLDRVVGPNAGAEVSQDTKREAA
jgi:hypothetical protein